MITAAVEHNLNSSQIKNTSNDNTINRRHLRNAWRKLARQKARLVFLLKCRRQEISPRFIKNKTSHLLQQYDSSDTPKQVKKQVDSLSNHIAKSILNIEIALCVKTINSIESHIGAAESPLSKNTEENIDENCQHVYTTELVSCNQQLNGKLQALLKQQPHLEDIKYDPTFIKNLSGVDIPDAVMTVLSLGPKFATNPTNEPILDLATDVEAVISHQIPKPYQREARGDVLYTMTKFSKERRKLNRIDKFLNKALEQTRIFLKNNRDVMVSNSDKGGVTIISRKSEYYAKIRELLSDSNSFEIIDRDPTKLIQGRVNRLLDKLYHASYISDQVKKNLKTWNTIPPRLFGQIKYHKPGNPIRLIVSTIDSAAYKISRFLATILRKAFTPKFRIKNSQQFIRTIRKTRITKGNVLVSYDVVNCFGTIPTALALSIIERDFHMIEQVTPIPKESFLQMLKLCLEQANYFVFADKFYRQKLGMFMGSSLAPILVERVIEHIVESAIRDLNITPDFWNTYVDDHLTSI